MLICEFLKHLNKFEKKFALILIYLYSHYFVSHFPCLSIQIRFGHEYETW